MSKKGRPVAEKSGCSFCCGRSSTTSITFFLSEPSADKKHADEKKRVSDTSIRDVRSGSHCFSWDLHRTSTTSCFHDRAKDHKCAIHLFLGGHHEFSLLVWYNRVAVLLSGVSCDIFWKHILGEREEIAIQVTLMLLWRGIHRGSSSSHKRKQSLASKIRDRFPYCEKHKTAGDYLSCFESDAELPA